MTEFQSEKQVLVTTLGTTAATLLGPVPPQMSLRIYSIRYSNPSAAASTGYLQQSDVLPGYSNNTGTQNIDAITLAAGATESDENGESVVTKVSAGNSLVGVVTAGSIIARITYEYFYGRT